ANDLYWGNFNSTGGHTFLANLFNQLLLTTTARDLQLDVSNLGDVRQLYNTSTTVIAFPETVGRRQLFADPASSGYDLRSVVRDLRAMSPCAMPYMFTQYCWLDFGRVWPVASSPRRQARCARSYGSNGAVYLEGVLRNLRNWDEWRGCWGMSFDVGFGDYLRQSSQGRAWLQATTSSDTALPISEEVAYWATFNLTRFTLQWQNYKTLGFADSFTIENALALEYTLTLSNVESQRHWDQETSHKMYWSFASDLWAIATNATLIGGHSLVRGSSNYAFANASSEVLLVQNLTLANPLSAGFGLLQSQLGPFGSVDMIFVPCPPSLLRWYETMQSALMELLVTDAAAQAAFVELPQKEYIGPFPAQLNSSSLSFEGGNLLCGDDHAASPEAFTGVVTSPLFRAFTPTTPCHALVFEFYMPDKFLVIFAHAGFAASRSVTASTLNALCLYDFTGDRNCPSIYSAVHDFHTAFGAAAFAAAQALAPAVEADVLAVGVRYLQFIRNGSSHDLFSINILDTSGDVSWAYFGWCAMYAWAAGTREVVAFDGDGGRIAALSGPLLTLSMSPSPAEVPHDVSVVLMASVQYITGVFVSLAALIAVYALAGLTHLEGRNLFQLNRTIGLVWVGRPFLLLRSLTAMVYLHTDVVTLTQVGVTSVFRSPHIPFLNLVLVSGEVNWLVYVLNDILSTFTRDATPAYATRSALLAWFLMLIWILADPCDHAATVARTCVAFDMDASLVCTSARVHIGFVQRLWGTAGLCLGCVAVAYATAPRRSHATPNSVLLSSPGKYMLSLEHWCCDGITYLDKASALMAGLVSVQVGPTVYILDIKKWRLFAVTHHDVPPQFARAVPLLH
ncbi:hypothetical protein ACHHYP_02813, partial [Achlya hypogyna]